MTVKLLPRWCETLQTPSRRSRLSVCYWGEHVLVVWGTSPQTDSPLPMSDFLLISALYRIFLPLCGDETGNTVSGWRRRLCLYHQYHRVLLVIEETIWINNSSGSTESYTLMTRDQTITVIKRQIWKAHHSDNNNNLYVNTICVSPSPPTSPPPPPLTSHSVTWLSVHWSSSSFVRQAPNLHGNFIFVSNAFYETEIFVFSF